MRSPAGAYLVTRGASTAAPEFISDVRGGAGSRFAGLTGAGGRGALPSKATEGILPEVGLCYEAGSVL